MAFTTNYPLYAINASQAASATPAAFRTLIGVGIGTDVQAFDASLLSLSALGTAANKGIYASGVDTFAEYDLTAFGRTFSGYAGASAALTGLGFSAFVQTIIDDANAATVLGTLGVSAFVQSIFDDANEAAVITTLGLRQSSTYTQTYSTADRTISAYTSDPESGAYSGIDNAQVGSVYAQLADLNALRVAYENLRAFVEDVAQALNAVIDDLQAADIVQ